MRERGAGLAFMLVAERPRGESAFVHDVILQQAALAWPIHASNEAGCVSLAAILQFHVLLLRMCPSDPGGSF